MNKELFFDALIKVASTRFEQRQKRRASRDKAIADLYESHPKLKHVIIPLRAGTGGLLGGLLGRTGRGKLLGAGVGGLAGAAVGKYERAYIDDLLEARRRKQL